MKKVLVGLSIAILALGAMGCSKQRASKTVTASNAAEAPAVAESIQQIEAMIQSNDAQAADPNTALTCKYVTISGNSISAAEIKTAGKCNWNELKGQVSAAGSLSGDAASKIISIISSDTTLPASAKAKWDCKAVNVKTNQRSVGAQDCKAGDGVNDATAKAIMSALGM